MKYQWSLLSAEGRKGVRRYYRYLRRGGMSRIMARILTHEVLYGCQMARWGWIEGMI